MTSMCITFTLSITLVERHTASGWFDATRHRTVPQVGVLNYGPYRLHAVYWMRPIGTDVARSVACMSVCGLGTRVSCAKRLNRSRSRWGGGRGGGGWHVWVQGPGRSIRCGPDLHGKEHFWSGNACAGPWWRNYARRMSLQCPAHVDECIHRRTAMRPLAKILWTLVKLTATASSKAD